MKSASGPHPAGSLPEGAVFAPGGDALKICENRDEFCRQAALFLTRCLQETLAVRRVAVVALAGGSTPQPVYEAMALAPLPWERIWFIPGDERLVGGHDIRSNARMMRQALGPRARLVPMVPDDWLPEQGGGTRLAESMAVRLGELATERQHGVPVLDMVLLGLGEDGHVASLFPGSEALDEKERWVCVSSGPVLPGRSPQVARLSLTFPPLGAARRLVFLVSGRAKAAAVQAVLRGNPAWPASRLAGRALWFLDKEAASCLMPQERPLKS